MSKNNPQRVLIIDDEEKILEVIESYLAKDGYEVYTATSGARALTMFDESHPALVILDLMLPDMTGEEICARMRKKSRVPIIMLTAKVGENDIINGLDLGADDYVTKPFSPRQLMARVAALLRRSGEDGGPLANVISLGDGNIVVDYPGRTVTKHGQLVNLTPNEFNLLTALLKYPLKVFTRDELIDMALGEDYEGYDRIIDTHIKNLRQKIETDPRNPTYILTVHGVGYKFGGD